MSYCFVRVCVVCSDICFLFYAFIFREKEHKVGYVGRWDDLCGVGKDKE